MQVSYCSQICNRLWQLAITLPQNLENLKDDEEIILVDYGSTDKVHRYLQEYDKARIAMRKGALKYAKVNGVTEYDCPKAKNISHRLGSGRVLVNLDVDNYLLNMRDAIDQTFKDKSKKCLHLEDPKIYGTYGRVAFLMEHFYMLGGYNEELTQSACQDLDIMLRSRFLNFEYINIPISTQVITNSMKEKSENTKNKNWMELRQINHDISINNCKNKIFVSNVKNGWGAASVVINFNKIILLDKLYPIANNIE